MAYATYFTSKGSAVSTRSTIVSVVAVLVETPFTRISTLTDSKSTVIGHWSDCPVVTNIRPEHPFRVGVDFSTNGNNYIFMKINIFVDLIYSTFHLNILFEILIYIPTHYILKHR